MSINKTGIRSKEEQKPTNPVMSHFAASSV